MLGVAYAAATAALIAGFGPLLGVLASRAAGLREGYCYWLGAGAIGWLAGLVQLAIIGGASLAARAALSSPAREPDLVVGVAILAVAPSVAVGVFVGVIIALRRRRDLELPTLPELRLRERYAVGEIDMEEFERRVERILSREGVR